MGPGAQPPGTTPPPFPPLKLVSAYRTGGNVEIPDPTADIANPLDLSWNVSAANGDVDFRPPKQRRMSTVQGSVLIVDVDNVGSKAEKKDSHEEDAVQGEAFFLHKRIWEDPQYPTYMKIAYPLKTVDFEGQRLAGSWEVVQSEKHGFDQSPFEMVAVRVSEKISVEVEACEANSSEDASTKEEKPSFTSGFRANAIAASQMIAEHKPEGNGHVLLASHYASDKMNIYEVLPYHTDSLLDYIGTKDSEHLDEPESKRLFKQILKGLQTIHEAKLCHRNLSLDKVVLVEDDCYITGLGWSLRVPETADGKGFHLIKPELVVGTDIQSVAPEILRSEAFDGFAIDMWAAAVMLSAMLFGRQFLFAAPIPEDPKFYGICVASNLQELVTKYRKLVKAEGPPISEDAIDLLQKMLKAEPKDRLSLQEALEHPWFKDIPDAEQ